MSMHPVDQGFPAVEEQQGHQEGDYIPQQLVLAVNNQVAVQTPVDKILSDRIDCIQKELATYRAEIRSERQQGVLFKKLLDDYLKVRSIAAAHDYNFVKLGPELRCIAETFKTVFHQLGKLSDELVGPETVSKIKSSLDSLKESVDKSLALNSFTQSVTDCLNLRQDNLVKSMATITQVDFLHELIHNLRQELRATQRQLEDKLKTPHSSGTLGTFSHSERFDEINNKIINLEAQFWKNESLIRKIQEKLKEEIDQGKALATRAAPVEANLKIKELQIKQFQDSVHFSDTTQDRVNSDLKSQIREVRQQLQQINSDNSIESQKKINLELRSLISELSQELKSLRQDSQSNAQKELDTSDLKSQISKSFRKRMALENVHKRIEHRQGILLQQRSVQVQASTPARQSAESTVQSDPSGTATAALTQVDQSTSTEVSLEDSGHEQGIFPMDFSERRHSNRAWFTNVHSAVCRSIGNNKRVIIIAGLVIFASG